MYPLLTTGDVVAVDKNANFSDITIGDIIVFKEPVPDADGADAIISRVNEINDPHDDESCGIDSSMKIISLGEQIVF